MGRTSNSDKCRKWHERITEANKVFEEWDSRFKCDKLEDYYLGTGHWPASEKENDRYTINLVYATIEADKPSLLFYRPGVVVTPRPERADDPMTDINPRAQLQQDVLQTFVSDRRTGFVEQTNLALHESYFRFGVVEVGYTADYIDNPNAGRPLLKENSEEPMVDSSGGHVLEPDRVVSSENLFYRWIPAGRFRVGGNRNTLEWNDWCGYWEWVLLEDVMRNPRYKNTTGLRATARAKDVPSLPTKPGYVRLWKIWDMRDRVKHVMADGHDKFLIQGDPYQHLPLSVLRFHPILDSFYPLPPAYNWIDPQREYNDVRDSQRVHRRRFKRRYTVQRGSIDEAEIAKFSSDEDGVFAWRNSADDPIKPVSDAQLDYAVTRGVQLGRDDFRLVSGLGGEQQGQADADTATQASIVESRLQVRESFSRLVVGSWLGEILSISLKTIREKMALPFWVERVVDPLGPQSLQETMNVEAQWTKITSEDLGPLEFDVSVDIESLSPITEDTKRRQWGELLTLLGNPPIMLAMLASETLMKKTLAFYGIRGAKEIAEFRTGMQAIIGPMMQAQQAQSGGPRTPQGVDQQAAAGPEMAQTMAQLGAQTGVQT